MGRRGEPACTATMVLRRALFLFAIFPCPRRCAASRTTLGAWASTRGCQDKYPICGATVIGDKAPSLDALLIALVRLLIS